MVVVGIVLGLIAALIQAISFVITRRFIVNGHGSVARVLTQGHLLMGLGAAVILPFCWDDRITEWNWCIEAAGAAGFYALGQVGLLAALGNSDASRVAPLLGLKVPFVACLAMVLLREPIEPVQWVAVALSVAAAFLLNRIGGNLPKRVGGGVVFAAAMFASSDIFIVKLIDTMGEGFPAAARSVCLVYMICGTVAIAASPWAGSRDAAAWRATIPYAAVWLPSMFFLFASLWMCKPVLGNIVIAQRGLFAIGLGALLAWLGHEHLEQKAPRSVIVRRGIAAILMIGAIILYGFGGGS
jgi:drug/metabolite transporter (DMT)-like permease